MLDRVQGQWECVKRSKVPRCGSSLIWLPSGQCAGVPSARSAPASYFKSTAVPAPAASSQIMQTAILVGKTALKQGGEQQGLCHQSALDEEKATRLLHRIAPT